MITPYKKYMPNYVTRIKACLFLAVPHRDAGNTNMFDEFLTILANTLMPGMGPNSRYIEESELISPKLVNITDRFIELLNENDIKVISCYENRDYAIGKGKVRIFDPTILRLVTPE